MSNRSLEPIVHVLESCLCVTDLAAAERFYGEVLGLTFYSRQPGRHVFFRCGDRMVLLFDAAQSSLPSHGDLQIPPHGTTGAGHLCFAMPDASLDVWAGHLTDRGVAIERLIQWPGGGRSLYFRDPSGNSLELATPRIWGIGEESLSPSS
ncbi:MAG: VOC family protein [Pirellulaceae bacterium]|nr:VOC family protein [Pirellulaceae bacterium]